MKGRSSPPSASRTPSGPTAPERPAWIESLPFFVVGGASVTVAAALLLSHSPAALAHLPVWTYLLAIGSISLVGGTVATFVGEPIPDLPGENELVGADLIVVSRTRWSELNKMERWVEGRLVSPEPAAAPKPRAVLRTPSSPPPRTGLRAVPDPTVPTLDELLADLPGVQDPTGARGDPWTETDDSHELPQPVIEPMPRPPPRRAPAPARPTARTPQVRSVRPGAAGPGARAESSALRSPDPDLERLLTELETVAAQVVEDREVESALPATGLLLCASCGRTVGITEPWEHCDECLGLYCDRCDDRLAQVGPRMLCPMCRSAARKTRR